MFDFDFSYASARPITNGYSSGNNGGIEAGLTHHCPKFLLKNI
ncbi:hypothetical protein ARAF_2424 [Arsenophonus endosymbiont of Aleurodicus floccissimus]|nr:hypothetical protein [Arsenophonus endosymbiont of Aleurodicus floccissimus]SPP32379.1 hypothetical protein ARAF_2424 [Arsenophonus endosymbiont of Aleurodicus floccissimus]